jgi:uncharacterized protein (TIGR00661 family)
VLSQNISFQNKRVLVCPLDWGLGHTARCIPILKLLQKQNNTVVVACDQKQKAFLSREVDGLEFVDLFGYNVRYSRSLPLWFVMMLQFSRLRSVVRRENKWLEGFLKENKIDIVISDNRFGLYNKNVETVFITHQLFIKAPFLSGWINSINHKFIKKSDHCWVPDFEDKNISLACELSHGEGIFTNTSFIGPLSRFTKEETTIEKIYDVLILLSGIEPQRSLLEEKLVGVFTNTKLKVVLVRGAETPRINSYPENFIVKNIATTKELHGSLCSSKNIICRSGYSTLMDLHALGLEALLIPTPGQTEQEYLAEYWNKKFGFKILNQNSIAKEAVLKLIQAQEIPQPQI